MKDPLPTQEPSIPSPFDTFENETKKKSSSNTLKDDIQRFLNKHLGEQREQIEDKLSEIELRCSKEVKEAIKDQLGPRLEENFNRLVSSHEKQMQERLDSLTGGLNVNLARLDARIERASEICGDFDDQYRYMWFRPLVTVIVSTALTGALIGWGILLMQASPLAVFLMDEKTRAIYERGKSMPYLLDKSAAAKHSQPTPQKKKPSK